MKNNILIAHIIYRFDIGGLENGLVNLINRMPKEHYRHIVICASDFTDFKNRIKRNDVQVYALHKKAGNDFSAQYRLWKLLRKLKPDIVHTRNLGTIEYTIPAFLAGVKYRIHGEHGRDMTDIDGTNKKTIFLRKLYNPFVNKFIALSRDLQNWLISSVGISQKKVIQLYNGVDIGRFSDKNIITHSNQALHTVKEIANRTIVVGTVGRLQSEKDQATLIRAFARLCNEGRYNIELRLIGDGPERARLEVLVKELVITDYVHFLGAREDVPLQMSCLDIFVLPSLGEGISNTILEAMASGLPVVATLVGGNPELVVEGKTGYLVPPNNPMVMAEAITRYLKNVELISQHGVAGRKRVEDFFSLDVMVKNYVDVYDQFVKSSMKERI